MRTSTIAGLKISGTIPPVSRSSSVFPAEYKGSRTAVIVLDGPPTRWADGSVTHWLDCSVAGKAIAFVRWLTPNLEDVQAGAIVRARYSSVNWETGSFEALVYGEFAGDVLTKANRLCRTLDFHVSEA